MRIKSISIVVVLWLTSCGYHLQGGLQLPAPFNAVLVRGASAELNAALNIRLADSKTSANSKPVIISVDHEKMLNRPVSLNVSGYANEYELHYKLHFVLQDKHGAALSQRLSVKIRKDYLDDQRLVLAKDNEKQVITAEIYSQAAKIILAKSQIALQNRP